METYLRDGEIYRYPLTFRYRPVAVILVILISVVMGSIRGIPHPPPTSRLADFITWVMMLILMPMLLSLCLYSIRMSWFFLHMYRFSGAVLEEIAPMLWRSRRITLDDIVEIRSFKVVGGTNKSSPELVQGYVLIACDDTEVNITEILPFWPEIIGRLDKVPIIEQPFIKRWVL